MSFFRHSSFVAALMAGAALVQACGNDAAVAPRAPSDAASTTTEDAGELTSDAGSASDATLPPDLRAGVFVVDVTPDLGVPLAGYTKRRRLIPDLDPNNLVRYFGPSESVRDPIRAKALVLESGGERVYFLSIDAVATLGEMVDRIVAAARAKGSLVTREHLITFASHTHSGPGALTSLGFWVQAATDDLVAKVRDAFVEDCATAITQAESKLEAARFGIGSGELRGVTKNRRAGVSKVMNADDIDPALDVMRVDRPDGTPIATLYNYAIHPTVLQAGNMALSADVTGAIASTIETETGAPALFANGAEGDIAPSAEGEAALAPIGAIVGAKVVEVRKTAILRDRIKMRFSSETVDFGDAKLTLRVDGLSSGALDLGGLATLLGGFGNAQTIPLDTSMVDHSFHMMAVALDDEVISAIPGEPIHTLGAQIRTRGKALGFSKVLLFGLANGHMSYVTDEAEYQAGGYEAAATFFGPDTGSRLVDACVARLAAVRP